MDRFGRKMVLGLPLIKIRLICTIGLIFSFLICSCTSGNKQLEELTIRWEQNRATGLRIPRQLLNSLPNDSLANSVHITLKDDTSQTAILGEWLPAAEEVWFEPLIPFTRGLTYQVQIDGQPIGQLQIPIANAADAPEVVSIYPTKDTLPHNLLKMYIRFSKPMQTGKALEQLVLIKDNRDTLKKVFLDLQPELWNQDYTLLTLWLDPGRIKRDLQPNKQLGEPLQQNSHYRLYIRPDWPGTEGLALKQAYQKVFVVTHRDSLSPDPDQWQMQLPKAGTSQVLKVHFREPLDYSLLMNAVYILDKQGKQLPGQIGLSNQESTLLFEPAAPWQPGIYQLAFESRLEDLAGNNLARLFDRDITISNPAPFPKTSKKFTIQ
jgi:hypothetical protein